MQKPLMKVGPGWEVRLSPDGRLVCVMQNHAEARLYRTDDWSQVCVLKGVKAPSQALFTADSSRVAIASVEKKVGLFDTTTGEPLGTVRSRHKLHDPVSLTPDGEHIVSMVPQLKITDDDTSLEVFSFQTGKSVDRLVVCDDASSVHVAKGTMFTRNGRYLFLSWRRYANGYCGYLMSVYQWPQLKLKATVAADGGDNSVELRELFAGKGANSVLVAAARNDPSRPSRVLPATQLWQVSCPSLKKKLVWEAPDLEFGEFSGLSVSHCGKQFTHIARQIIVTRKVDDLSIVRRFESTDARSIISAELTKDRKHYVANFGAAIHVHAASRE